MPIAVFKNTFCLIKLTASGVRKTFWWEMALDFLIRVMICKWFLQKWTWRVSDNKVSLVKLQSIYIGEREKGKQNWNRERDVRNILKDNLKNICKKYFMQDNSETCSIFCQRKECEKARAHLGPLLAGSSQYKYS